MENPLDIIKSPEKKEASADAKSVRDLIQTFLKARKNLRLYPENNPIFLKTIDEVYKRASDILSGREGIVLRVTRNEIFYGGEQVYEGAGKEDNLAMFFFRDGLRELVIKPELTKEELRRFLGIISVDLDRETAEDDLVTLLWESDFQSISYKVDETVLLDEDTGYEERAQEQAKSGACTDDCIRQAYDEATNEEDVVKETMIVPITDDDLRYLAIEIEKDREDKKGKTIEIIFSMLSRVSSVTELKDLAQILCGAIDYCMKQGDLGRLVLIVTRTKDYMGRASNDQIKTQLRTVVAYASSQAVVRTLGLLFESGVKVDEEGFNQYVSVLEPGAVGPFMTLLGEVRIPSVRDTIIKTLARIGKNSVDTLARGLKDKREAYVAGIVHVLRLIGGRQAAEQLMKFPPHYDMRIRREVVKAIGEMGGTAAAPAILPYLEDMEQTVRVAAIRALASNGTEPSLEVLLARAGDKKILSLDFDEMKVCFEALARWKDPKVLEFLSKILKETSLFNRSKHSEQKACALYALGLTGIPEALPVLEKYRDSGNKLLSDYAAIAIRRLSHGR